MKGKSAIYIARKFGNRRTATGHTFWARGYFVATVGRDEQMIRKYIRHPEEEDQKLEQMNLFGNKRIPPLRGSGFKPPVLPEGSDFNRLKRQ
jgi:putative transposase